MCKIRCRVCTSRAQPRGRVFQCNTTRTNDVVHFIRQHLKGPNHISNMASWVAALQREKDAEHEPLADDVPQVPCEGICLTSGQMKASIFRSELLLWASMSQLKKSLAKHTYYLDLAGEVVAFHEQCRKVCPQPPEGERPACASCKDSLGDVGAFFPISTFRGLKFVS